MKRFSLIFAIPVGIALVMALLLAFGWTSGVENRVYDTLLGLRPSPHQSSDLVLVEVDDRAVSTVGTWPISRSITADGLLLLKEMGARYAVFDIEYLNKSPRGVDAAVLEEDFPSLLKEEIGRLSENNSGLVEALRTRRFPLAEAGSLARDFKSSADAATEELSSSLQRIAIDNDARLAQAITVFGNAFLTVNVQDDPDPNINPAFQKTAIERFSLDLQGRDLLVKHGEIIPVIEPILSAARGIGFTNVKVDDDGVRRRIDLAKRHNEVAFAQLGFSPFLDLVGHPTVELTPSSVLLKGATYPDGNVYDVTIPRAQDGSILINWPHTQFVDSFRHLSFYYLYVHDQLYNNLIHNLQARNSWGYLDPYQGNQPLLEAAAQLQNLREGLISGEAPPSAIADYRAGRDAFLKELGDYLASKPDDTLLAQVKDVLAQTKLTAEQRRDYETIEKDLPDWFAKTRDIFDNLMKMRTDQNKLGGLTGAFCFLGNTNTGSTDLGVTPFQKQYPNLGTHASVVNMLLQRDFVVDASPWWSWVIGLGGALLLTQLLRGRKPVVSLSVGSGVSLAVIVVFAALFVVTGLYVPVLPAAALIVLSFLGTTFFQFLTAEKEKGFLRSAFGRYLSNDVIQQIIANPDQLKLGGQQKVMTAMFTDIRGFSTISEAMSAEELVFLLNQYLTKMSDIILDLQGTIDKYEGDAIIAFFGAPVDLEDHARRACLAAVRMKRAEEELNLRFQQDNLTPHPLMTRIGINTGPMVVGNMGTDRKMDYTIIGDSVNLAARLEGVNKLYSTWILISEDTRNLVEDVIETRRLDRVRVVGKSVPIRLYQVVEEKGQVPELMERLLPLYNTALDEFEARRWPSAVEAFDACLKVSPEDGPSLRYRKLAAEYVKTPPPATWDGVFKMETK